LQKKEKVWDKGGAGGRGGRRIRFHVGRVAQLNSWLCLMLKAKKGGTMPFQPSIQQAINLRNFAL
jgi:hypothetical protein